MIESSLINLYEAVKGGRTISKGHKVSLPIEGEASVYGFIAIEDNSLNLAIDMPPLGEAKVLSNRVIFSYDKNFYRFPIFNSVCRTNREKYGLYLLYVPRFLNLTYKSHIDAYRQSMANEIANPNVAKVPGVKIEDKIAYYYPYAEDFYFESASKLSGIGSGFAVIIRRISSITGDVKYEVYEPNEVLIEKS